MKNFKEPLHTGKKIKQIERFRILGSIFKNAPL